jgi:hypothetical protein
MTEATTDERRAERPRFARKEREHLDVLHARLERLHTERHPDDDHLKGETHALAWALGIIEGTVEPVEVRVEKALQQIRKLANRVAALEREFEEDDV